MIDWDFETRLIDRIAARELLATRLNARQRSVLCGRYRHGQTLEQVGESEGVSRERIRQIEVGAFRRLLNVPLPLVPEPPPSRRIRAPTHDDFDKAQFLHHMQLLIRRREAATREAIERQAREEEGAFKRERQALDRLLGEEAPPPQPAPKPASPPPKPAPPPPPLSEFPPLPLPPHHQSPGYIEPWFRPLVIPTLEHMRQIGLYALHYFVSAVQPWQLGTLEVGTQRARARAIRDADAVATAMQELRRAIPASAKLSAAPFLVPEDHFGVTVSNKFAAICVLLINGYLYFELSWSYA